jgi:hypothetical protein
MKRVLGTLALVVLLGVVGWTAWVVTRPNPVNVDQATCDAAGDHYHALAEQPFVDVPNRRTATPAEYRAAQRERQEQRAERRAALRAFDRACEVGAQN